MLDEIDRFVNWIRRRNPEAHTWRDYRCDLQQFTAVVGDRPPDEITFHDIDEFIVCYMKEAESLFKQRVLVRFSALFVTVIG